MTDLSAEFKALADYRPKLPLRVMTVEGEKDDISAPGQCVAALSMLPGLPEAMKTQHLEPGAGHYGIFAGKSWRLNIRPLVLKFIDANAGAAKPAALKVVPAQTA